jgi:hypothetical protein
MIPRLMSLPKPTMKPRPPMPRDQLVFMAVLILLTLLVILLWFADPAHQYSGQSRVGWPPASSPKP